MADEEVTQMTEEKEPQVLTAEQLGALSQEDYVRHRSGEAVTIDAAPEQESAEAPAEESQMQDESETQESEEPAPPEEAAAPSRAARRTRKLERMALELEEANRRIAHLEGANEVLERTSAAPDPMPKAEDFNSDEEWADALADWKIEERKRTAKTPDTGERESSESSESTQAREEAPEHWTEQVEQATTQHDDFAAVAYAVNLDVSDVMVRTILESDNGAEVLYWLGKNPKESTRICGLDSELSAAREIGKIEHILNDSAKQGGNGETKPAPKLSQTPEPIQPLDSGGPGASAAETDLNKVDQATYNRIRRRQEEERYG